MYLSVKNGSELNVDDLIAINNFFKLMGFKQISIHWISREVDCSLDEIIFQGIED